MKAHEVVRQVALLHGVAVHHVLGPRRWSELVSVRKKVARILFEAGLSYPEIGRALRKDHTTAMYYVGAIKARPTTKQEGNA